MTGEKSGVQQLQMNETFQERKVSICNSPDGYRAKAGDFDRKGLRVWILAS